MWLDTLAIALVTLQAIAIVLLCQQGRRLRRRIRIKRSDTTGASELLIVNALNKIDHRLSLLESRGQRSAEAKPRRSVEVPATQVPGIRSASLHSSANNYELAQQLAREGGDLEQLISQCGLSRNEAELVLRLYARRA